MKKLIVVITLCVAQTVLFAGKGGAFAGGFFGGAILGSAIASANRPQYVQAPPQTVVIRDEQPVRERIVYVDRETGERLPTHPDDYKY